MRNRLTIMVFLGLSLVLSAAAGSAGDANPTVADAQRGRVLAEKVCATCHLIATAPGGRVVAGVPTFHEIANRKAQTAKNIASALIKPHAPMPNIYLSRREIDDLIAYFDQLRKPDAGRPLIKRSGPAKPQLKSRQAS